MYQALYRKYRPQTFDDVVGQSAVTTTLKNQLQSGRLSHAYLFTGSRGTGKTSSAKILAKAVNCEFPIDGNPCNCCKACQAIDSGACMDVLEIDAASNNGVDNVRDLRDDAIYTPSQVKKRVYIIDEVHMLSISAFNALLKIIEEPPEHLLFILATTELHKVPATILSRCQRFSFRRISQEDIAARLQYVAYQENIEIDEAAARIIARLADGGMRDGLSLLDQCASAITGTLTPAEVYKSLGIAGIRECGEMMAAIASHDAKTALTLLDRAYAEGKDLAAMLDELACLCRDMMVLQTAPREGIALLSGVASDQQALELSARFSAAELVYMLTQLQTTLANFTRSASRRLDAELCVLNLCQPDLHLDIESLNARLGRVEQMLKNSQLPNAKQTHVDMSVEDAVQEDVAHEEPEEIPLPPSEAPPGFWPDLASQLRKELRPPLSGLFAATSNAPVQGALVGNRLELRCESDFSLVQVNTPKTLQLVSQKASAMLGCPISAVAIDRNSRVSGNKAMESLVDFARNHSGIVNIKD